MKKHLGERFLFDKNIDFGEIEGGEGYTYSDGSGYFNGFDGTEIYIYSDKSGYYRDKNGSDGYIYADGSGYFRGSDGTEGYIESDGTGYFKDEYGHRENYKLYSDSLEYNKDSDWKEDIKFGINSLLEIYALKQRIEEEEKRKIARAKRKKFFNKYKKIIVPIIIFVILSASIGIGIGIYKIVELEKSRITIKKGYKYYEEMNYEDVVIEFKDMGFKNIETIPAEDLITGWINKENTIKEIKIGEDKKIEKGESFYPNEKVEIIYHSFKKKKK